jgi:hypothetical protein
MERNKPLSIDARERLNKLINELDEDHFAAPGDTTSDKPPRTAISKLIVTQELLEGLQERRQGDVDEARDDGATFAQIAPALKLANASSVHFTYGKRKDQDTVEESREVRQARARERAAKSRQRAKEKYPTPEVPGVSALQAASILGIDPRTVRSRAKRGNDPHITAVTFTSAKGKETTRFLVTTAGAEQS